MAPDGLIGHWPDYDSGSIVNLMSSIGQRFGRQANGYNASSALQGIDLADYEQCILLVVDGLGYEYLQNTSGLLKANRSDSLTSVFPSTTATSITTFLTGQAPQQHGLTGWFTYLEEVDGVTAVLPCMLRGSESSLSDLGVNIARLYKHPIFFDELNCASHVVSQNWILGTDFNQSHTGRAQTHGYETLIEMFEVMQQCVNEAKGEQFIYAYWSEFDHLSHIHGNQSENVKTHFKEIQTEVEKFVQNIKGKKTLLMITADHGFIDTTPEQCITVNEHSVLHDCLSMPLSGEPRAAYCYVKPDKHDVFVDYVNSEFSEKLQCVASQELLEKNAFGLGQANSRLSKRIGDYALIMKDNFIIKDWMACESYFFHYGVHGGVSQREMYVPLIILES